MSADLVPPGTCRACHRPGTVPVLDLGEMPAADHFPTPDEPAPDATAPLAMLLCPTCGLVQLAHDGTGAEEPRAVEPQAVRDQATQAFADLLAWDGAASVARTVTEFGSPHGGSWLPMLHAAGWRQATGPAGLVVDGLGLMHAPDQDAAMTLRLRALSDDGVLLLVVHSLETILRLGQWTSLRHGHFAYWSLTALVPLLAAHGLQVRRVLEYPLYGGTLAVLATRGGAPDSSVARVLAREAALGVTDPLVVGGLQRAADRESEALAQALRGGRLYAYGAASRAVALLMRAGANPSTVPAVADASPAKQGRCLPGTRIPVVSPEALVQLSPHRVWLLLPDLLAEVSAAYPELAGRWLTGMPS